MSKYVYKPTVKDIERFADQVGIKCYLRGDEVLFIRCPYCQEQSRDTKTFSINTETGQFNCFRAKCQAKGNMLTLARDFGFQLPKDVQAYYQPETQNFKKFTQKEIVVRDGAVEYFKSRGISKEIVERYKVTTRTDDQNVLVFPFMNEKGITELYKYRCRDFDKEKYANKEWAEAGMKPILFGMHQCDLNDKTLIMTEGQIDSMSVAQCGFQNVVSVPNGCKGFTWKPFCWDWLCNFDELIVFGDYENGHMTLLEEMAKTFHGIVKHVQYADYLGCKDANEILKHHGQAQIVKCIEGAVHVEDVNIIDLANVERPDASAIERVPSGFRFLDKYIEGFYRGQLIVLTGERGKGKSQLSLNLMANALDNGLNCMLYSGEMADWVIQDQFDKIIGGRDSVNTMMCGVGDAMFEKFTVNAEMLGDIRNTYASKVKLYKYIPEKEDNAKLTDEIEKCVKCFGTEFVIVDNIMTAMEDDATSDIYRMQTVFTRKLKQMAQLLNIIIVLVAHPKKLGKDDFQNDDVSGSSNITNLADMVLRYDTPTKKEEDNNRRILQVLKNRMNGRRCIKGIEMMYEPQTGRIVDEPRRFAHNYIKIQEDNTEPVITYDEIEITDDMLPF